MIDAPATPEARLLIRLAERERARRHREAYRLLHLAATALGLEAPPPEPAPAAAEEAAAAGALVSGRGPYDIARDALAAAYRAELRRRADNNP